jgi:hypothetical protein
MLVRKFGAFFFRLKNVENLARMLSGSCQFKCHLKKPEFCLEMFSF